MMQNFCPVVYDTDKYYRRLDAEARCDLLVDSMASEMDGADVIERMNDEERARLAELLTALLDVTNVEGLGVIKYQIKRHLYKTARRIVEDDLKADAEY